ncbi:MAG: SDR family NAD(P)-dependent oxidoreductase [Actinophytocola sp.]|uniref:SDR family oxidoreductase n=1 Tax=Actinophytocola sp. TaxID=1872138 RepID=UPI001322771A|nr:SDR family oxidoreductase [Actinophytocola sp.]MPZ85205.1 SDR family NAD(P)-dependent oxidoreductase [Actinophytocola sp.]
MRNGEIALVTGANKGIGKEIVRRLAVEGFTVYLGARDEDRGRAAAEQTDGDVRFVHLDVTDEDSVAAAAKRVEQAHGRLDVLVNNAGVAVEWGVAPERIGADVLRRAYAVNVFGVASVTRSAIPLLREGSRVVNMSSPLGSLTLMSDPASPVSTRHLLAYSSSKAALNALTVLYANVLRPKGVLVNAANPGLVGTDLNGLDAERDGVRTVERGAEVPVRLALLAADGPTGGFFGDDDHATAGVVPW